MPSEDKTHNSGLVMNDQDILVPKKMCDPQLPSHAYRLKTKYANSCGNSCYCLEEDKLLLVIFSFCASIFLLHKKLITLCCIHI